jgi:hypothetical protein
MGNYGQFGNQLFQIAAVLGYAARHGCRPRLPRWRCAVSGNDYEKYFPWIKAYYGRCSGAVFRERHFYYEELPFIYNLDLRGNFQSEKYFNHIKERIRQLYAEPASITAELDEYCSQNGLHRYDAMHVRFYSDSFRDRGPMEALPAAYFRNAIALMDSERPLVVATDNKVQLAELLATSELRRKVHVLRFENSLLDFYMLSRARRIAISNSSFSWWAAYLGARKERIIAPHRYYWFRRTERANPFWDTRDLYPDEFSELIL